MSHKWNNEEILAVGATRATTSGRGPLQKETATNRLTTSHRIRAVSGRIKDVIMEVLEVAAMYTYLPALLS